MEGLVSYKGGNTSRKENKAPSHATMHLQVFWGLQLFCLLPKEMPIRTGHRVTVPDLDSPGIF